MEAPYGNNNSSSRVLKLKDLNFNVSPINAQRDNHQFFIGGGGGGRFHHPPKSPTFDPYAAAVVDKSNLENLDSTLIRYLRSGSPPSAGDAFKSPAAVDSPKYRSMIGHQYLGGKSSSSSGGSGGFGSRGSTSVSPLSAVENLETPPSRSPPVFKTPVKVEEDVLVMDGILVGSVAGGGRLRMSASSDSGGSSSSGSNNSFYKREICRSWEDSSHCRYGSKCQFAHGKEEVRPSRFPIKNKSEICKSYSSSGSCSYGAKCRFAHHQVMTGTSPTEMAMSATKVAKNQSISPIKLQNSNDGSSKSNGSKSSSKSSGSRINNMVTNTDWSPMDDGIEVSIPSSVSTDKNPSREAVDAYINSVLYGPPRGKRLPVFTEICPE